MKTRVLGIVVAVIVHAGLILFGGVLFWRREETKVYQQVELVSDEATKAAEEKEKDKQKDKPKETEKQTPEERVESEAEQAPDANELVRSIEASAAAATPALEAASLGAIEAALGGAALSDGGDFASALSFASGGRIGGLGKPGGMLSENMEQAFSLAEIDQKPRAIFQTAPNYPAELRARKVEGVVQVLFVVDQQGKVLNARSEQSTHEAFIKPALEAVRHWKFEPAIKGGQKVQCKMRIPIRFQPS